MRSNKEQIENILNQFSEIIVSFYIKEDYRKPDKQVSETKIKFIDSSKLENREVLIFLENKFKERRYKFQWMKEDNSLIIRWDNAPNHQEIQTFPFHKHVGEDSNVQESPEVTLFVVLNFIRKSILS